MVVRLFLPFLFPSRFLFFVHPPLLLLLFFVCVWPAINGALSALPSIDKVWSSLRHQEINRPPPPPIPLSTLSFPWWTFGLCQLSFIILLSYVYHIFSFLFSLVLIHCPGRKCYGIFFFNLIIVVCQSEWWAPCPRPDLNHAFMRTGCNKAIQCVWLMG